MPLVALNLLFCFDANLAPCAAHAKTTGKYLLKGAFAVVF